MSIETEALFRGTVYRVTSDPVVANLESKAEAARELHLATCRTLRKYPEGSPALVALTDAEADQAWLKALEEDTAIGVPPKEWPFSAETAWCPICLVKVVPVASDGSYKHPLARSAKWRPGIPLACRFPTAHGLGHCGCDDVPAAAAAQA